VHCRSPVDYIAVVEGGRIVELGKHDELISRPSGRYANLVKHQLSMAQNQDRFVESPH
jgi:ABC-type multidrug transport system fused ATPase/permease subunit